MLNLDIFPSEMLRGVPSLCNLQLQQYSLLYIQILLNVFLHIEDVHLLFCANFIFFTFLTDVELRHFQAVFIPLYSNFVL